MDAHGIAIGETVSASSKLGKKDAGALAKAASRVYVAKGKKLDEFRPGGKADATTVAAMLGPTGNLRAPTLRFGKTVVVGFNEELYSDLLG
ncbi:hypothetical protein MK489_21420 [Myxococcota bacterium]|nr:hypothetical protein [Myxococcota bacterium]